MTASTCGTQPMLLSFFYVLPVWGSFTKWLKAVEKFVKPFREGYHLHSSFDRYWIELISHFL